MSRYVHPFDARFAGNDARAILGGKGAGLSEMTSLGIPVPPGFTVTTDACRYFRDHGGSFPEGLEAQVSEALERIEAAVGRRFGDAADPLLVSVRSGAKVSMPGMMDTILNLGLNDETVEGLARSSGDRRFAFDAYRRLLQMYGDVVLGVPHSVFEDTFTRLKVAFGGRHIADSKVPAEGLEDLVDRYKKAIEEHANAPFPTDVHAQLWGAIGAVFRSWDNARAIRYRKMQGIPGDWGTACNVQAMVFGNLGDDSGSGVAFTRNPSNGERVLYGEYLQNAQGEDVVAGIRTPLSLTVEGATPGREGETLERKAPEIFAQIRDYCVKLEAHFRDMQDIEFTVERGVPYILQTRNGKRTAHAAVKIAVDMVKEGMLSREEAVLRVDPKGLDQLLHPRLPTPDELGAKGIRAIASGLPASPGAAIGEIVFDADEAVALAAKGKDVILVRRETSPEDIHGMKAAHGIVTATGGMTSHAAVVARGLGKCCVAGATALTVDYRARTITVRGEGAGGSPRTWKAGDVITLDGTHGKIYEGELEVFGAATMEEFDTLMTWADEQRRLEVRANTDTPRGAKTARSFGAQGIGLCRTEHMFFAEDRLEAVRCMALVETAEERAAWLSRIEPMQTEDFVEIFRAMDGLPVTIRLLDWPLHEFLPREARDFEALATTLKISPSAVQARALSLTETNPMLGHRGVRVGLTFPEIYEMQVRAILRAAIDARGQGIVVRPEIMIPVVALAEELAAMRTLVDRTAAKVFAEAGVEVSFGFGTMIELPRACLVAGRLAQPAEFFSFGTNDLTQTTFGISRDDAGKFLPFYLDDPRGLLPVDPFSEVDREAVGELMRIAVERGRATRPDLHLGLCGEQGGEPASVAFCEEIGLDYVSCSPPRLPVARLAAAQAALRRHPKAGGA